MRELRNVPWWVWLLFGVLAAVMFVGNALADDRREVLPLKHDD